MMVVVMLIIGHRGAAGLAPENTLEALRAGVEAGADILEFDIRLTKDSIPVLSHDFHTARTHKKPTIISRHTLKELQQKTAENPIVTLDEVLQEFYGKILLNIELKSRGSGKVAVELLQEKYIFRSSDWDNVLFSSFKGSELWSIRKISTSANLALLHDQNPFMFIAYQRKLHLTAVGFHRLYLNEFALQIAKKSGLFCYVYTVNRPHAAILMEQRGIDGIVTNYPHSIMEKLQK